MVTTIITAMAAYSNERVAAIVISVLYRMLTFIANIIIINTIKTLFINKLLKLKNYLLINTQTE